MLRYVRVAAFFTHLFPALLLRGIKTVLWDVHSHPLIPLLGCNLLMMMKLEYTLQMVAPGKQPFDVGFHYTAALYEYFRDRPMLNSITAALNTAFVFLQIGYIIWAWMVDGRKRGTLAALLLYTCRGLMGYSTQLPLPQEFLGSELDFPVGNVSFFLFFSGHIGGSVIASLDLRRERRWRLAATVDFLNVLQWFRLLATRGHYTIDLIVGAVAGWACDHMAGKYEERKARAAKTKDFGDPENKLLLFWI